VSTRGLRTRLDRIEAQHAPRCRPSRLVFHLRPDDPEPVLTRPCEACGRLDCGVLMVRMVVVRTREEAEAVRARNRDRRGVGP
jgi:hypothetical protein